MNDPLKDINPSLSSRLYDQGYVCVRIRDSLVTPRIYLHTGPLNDYDFFNFSSTNKKT